MFWAVTSGAQVNDMVRSLEFCIVFCIRYFLSPPQSLTLSLSLCLCLSLAKYNSEYVWAFSIFFFKLDNETAPFYTKT